MADIYFRKNGKTYRLDWRPSDYLCEARLGFRFTDSRERSVPAMSTQGTKVYGGQDSNGNQYYYDTTSPTIAFRKNGKTYYCNKSATIANYSIPAGTYTISAFQTLIKNLYGISSWGIGKNGSYISKTWSNCNVKQDNKVPKNTSSREVRLYRYGNGQPYFSYDWLTGKYWCDSQWYNVAYLYNTNLVGIVMYAGVCAATPLYKSTYTNYPVTVVDGIDVT